MKKLIAAVAAFAIGWMALPAIVPVDASMLLLGAGSGAPPALSCSYTPVTTGAQSVAYTGATPAASGGTPSYTYSETGSLPTGLSIGSSTGIISGTPSANGTFTGIQVKVTDSTSSVANCGSSFTLTINAAAYAGPGDVYGTAYAWWGLRAFSAADKGNRLINICDSTKTQCADWSSSATTGLLVVGTNPLNGVDCTTATTCVINALYDRSGSTNCNGSVACDLQCMTACPTFTWNSGKPFLVFLASASSGMQSFPYGNMVAQTQPLTSSAVTDQTSSSGRAQFLTQDVGISGPGPSVGASAANTYFLDATTAVTFAAADSTWHASQVIFNGASSTFYLDGTGPTTVGSSPGTSGFDTQFFFFGAGNNANYLTGNMREGGWWIGTKTSGNQAALNTQQHSVWGF